MIPDSEAIIGDYLRGHSGVKALAARVVGETPTDPNAAPWVKVVQLSNPAVGDSRSEHLIEWMGDLHCYAAKSAVLGDEQEQASDLTRAVRGAMAEANLASHKNAVVTGVKFLSCPRLPDPDYEPQRQRYVLSVVVYLHGA